MLSLFRPLQISTAYVLLTLFIIPLSLTAQTHVVSPNEFQKQVLDASTLRERNVVSIRDFMSSEKAEKAMKSAHINPVQVKTAVSTLSDDDLAQLASRANKAQADFAAGALSERDLLLVVVAIAALILIIVAVR